MVWICSLFAEFNKKKQKKSKTSKHQEWTGRKKPLGLTWFFDSFLKIFD
jgi:hypothetical protein